MVRVVVVTTLMLVQLAGPLPCCCPTSRAAGPATARKEPAPPARRSCCGGRHDRPDHKREIPEERHPVEVPDCPCPLALTRLAAPTSSDNDTARSTRDRPVRADHLTPQSRDDGRTPGVAHHTDPNLPHLPFLTADDLLRALHILRC